MSVNLIDVYIKAIIDKSSTVNLIPVIRTSLQRAIHTVQIDMLNTKKRSDGYCGTFLIPEKAVLTVFDQFGVFTLKDLTSAFSAQWAVPVSAHMHNNPYYHVLCFCILLGAKVNDDKLCESAISLLLFKLWNGRRVGAIPYCDAETMAYVISQMSYRFHVKKYDSPFNMIVDYFVPTILTKYKPYILKDSTETKRLFEASHNRLRQLFRSNGTIDMNTGKEIYLSGIQPLYFEAKEKKLKISNTITNAENVEDSLSANAFDDKIETITDYIIMNSNPQYPPEFIKFLKDQSKTYDARIVAIIKAMHSRAYRDLIRDILHHMFNRMNFINKQIICNPTFMDTVQKSIISSKHNIDVNQAKDLADHLLSNILQTKLDKPVDYFSYLDTNRSQLRRIIFYTIAYNIKSSTCK